MINEEVKQKRQQVFQKAMDESFKNVVKEAVVQCAPAPSLPVNCQAANVIAMLNLTYIQH